MTLQDLLLPIALSGGAAAAFTFGVWKLLTHYYVPAPPNRALVLYGRRGAARGEGRPAGPGAVEMRPPRILVGGGAYVPPWGPKAEFLSLEPIDVDASVRVASTSGDALWWGWEAVIAIQVKIPAESAMLRAAAENLLGRSPEEIRRMVARAVEGATPSLLVRLATEGSDADWERLASEIQAAVARDLVASGLVIRSLALKELRRLPYGGGAILVPNGTPSSTAELLAGPSDESSRLAEVESRVGRTERTLDRLGAQLAGANVSGAFRTALPPYDPSGTELPFRSPRGDAPEAFGGGRARAPLDVKQ